MLGNGLPYVLHETTARGTQLHPEPPCIHKADCPHAQLCELADARWRCTGGCAAEPADVERAPAVHHWSGADAR